MYKRKIIVFNLLALSGNELYGVGNYVKNLLVDCDFFIKKYNISIIFIHYKSVNIIENLNLPLNPNIKYLRLNNIINNKILKVLWEQLVLPFYLIGRDVLFNPANINPLLLPKNIKSIITIYDLLPFKKSRYGLIQKNYLRTFTLLSARFSNTILTISEYSKTDIADILRVQKSKIDVVYHSLPITNVANYAARRTNTPYFLIIAGLNKDKRIDLAINGFGKFMANNKLECDLIILGGDQGELTNLKDITNSKGLKNNVYFEGFVEESTKWSYLNSCLGLILFGKNEGFGIPVLEALSINKPCIVSNSGSLPEVVGDVGFVIDPYDESEVASRMNDIYHGYQFDKTLISNHIMKFSSLIQREKFWKVFE